MMAFKVVVFGGGGFIGRGVVERLSKYDEIQLLVATRNKAQVESSSNYFYFDLCDEKCLGPSFEQLVVESDLVLNMAGEIRDERKMWAANYETPRRIAALLSKSAGHKNKYWIQLSSCGVFHVEFNKDIGVNSERVGRNTYEQSKLSMDRFLRELDLSTSVQVHTLYPSVVVTERDERLARLSRFLQKRFLRIFTSPKWTVNVICLDQLISEITERVLSIEQGKYDGFKTGPEKILNQPLELGSLVDSGRWTSTLAQFTQSLVKIGLKARLINGKLRERLLFIFSNVRYRH